MDYHGKYVLVSVAMIAASILLFLPFACQRDSQPASPSLSSLPVLVHPRLVVEKAAHRLTLYDGEKAVKVYRVITGRMPGDKVREGDRRTPEGDFYICYKNPNSKYTLSLGLSYPDIAHARRGLAAGIITRQQHDAIVKAIEGGGMPDWYTPLGGEVMLHGGGIDRSGTAGCVGMNDEDIGELFNALPLGTPVQIQP